MILIAHNIRSLHNVGSIFRSCDAFGIERLYLTGFTGAPPRPEIAKVALGGEHRISWEKVEDLRSCMQQLREKGYQMIALENGVKAQSIHTFKTEQPMALIVGNEVNGIDADVLAQCDQCIEIPMLGNKKSLNVSVATGIALFALTSQAR